MSWRNELTVGLLRAERIFYGTANGGLGSELTTTELGYLDDITPGTAEASKALILDASADLTSGINDFTIDNDLSVGGALNITGAVNITSGDFTIGVADTTEGDLTLYGAATGNEEGGRVVLQTAADYDTTINQFEIQAYEDDFQIGPNTSLDSFKYVGGSARWDFTDSYVRIGNDGVGPAGFLELMGAITGEGNGGAIWLYTADDYDTTISYFQIAANEDDFRIGPSTDLDSLEYAGDTGQWQFTGAGGVSVTGTLETAAITATGNLTGQNGILYLGVDDTTRGQIYLYGSAASQGSKITMYAGANEDTTIQNFIFELTYDDLTIGPDTNPDIFRITAEQVVDFTGALVNVGVEDVQEGQLRIRGPASFAGTGARLTLDVAGDYDTTITYYQIETYEDDLYIGPSNNNDMLKLTAEGTVVATVAVQTGNLTVDDGSGAQVLKVGADDTRAGNVHVYGGASDPAELTLYTSAAYDTTINSFGFHVYEDDLRIGPNTDAQALVYDGANTRWDFKGSSGVYVSGGDLVASHGQIDIGVNDSVQGRLYIMGGSSTDGGFVEVRNGAGYDGTVNYYRFYAGQGGGYDELAIGSDTDPDAILLDGPGSVLKFSGQAALVYIGADNADNGELSIFGDGGSGGGRLNIYVSGDDDTTYDYWTIHSDDGSSDSLFIETGGSEMQLEFDPPNTWKFEGNTQTVLDVGVDDTTQGVINLYNGFELNMYNYSGYDSTVNFYTIKSDLYEGDLIIGPNSDTDSIRYDVSEEIWKFTGAASGTYAYTGLLVEEGIICGNYSTAPQLTIGELNQGAANCYASATLYMAGAPTGEANGPSIIMYVPDSYDATINSFNITNTQDDLLIGPSNDTDALKYNGATPGWEFNGALDIKSTLSIAGTAVASTAAELDTFYLNIHIPDISTNTYAAVVVPEACTFEKVESVLWGTIAGADDTLTFTTSSGAVTNTLVIAYSGSNAGDIDSMTPGDNQACAAGTAVSLSNSAGSTNSVPVTLTLHFKRS